MTGLSVELKYPIQNINWTSQSGPLHEVHTEEIRYHVKNGTQHAMNVPMIIPEKIQHKYQH